MIINHQVYPLNDFLIWSKFLQHLLLLWIFLLMCACFSLSLLSWWWLCWRLLLFIRNWSRLSIIILTAILKFMPSCCRNTFLRWRWLSSSVFTIEHTIMNLLFPSEPLNWVTRYDWRVVWTHLVALTLHQRILRHWMRLLRQIRR